MCYNKCDEKGVINMAENYGKDNVTFSNDLNKFNQDCREFINYVKQCVQNANNGKECVLFLSRSNNELEYGENGYGTMKIIEMESNEDLRKLYKLIQTEFSSDFVNGFRHTYGEGMSLNPMIGENVLIDINSDNSYDQNWFYKESVKEEKNVSAKKR